MLQCNISNTINDMHAGILASLSQPIEKHSTQLNRTAVYKEESRISRLPMYLSVHFVRFYWRRDINKYVLRSDQKNENHAQGQVPAGAGRE